MSEEINVAFKIPVAVNDEAGRQAAARGVSKATILAESVVRGLADDPVGAMPSVDQAVTIFRQYLPERVNHFMDEMTLQEGRQPLEMLVSGIITIFDQHQLGIRTPEAPNEELIPRPAMVTLGTQGTCAWCHKPFTITRVGEKYCPEKPDSAEPSCGRLAFLDQVRQGRASRHRSPMSVPTVS